MTALYPGFSWITFDLKTGLRTFSGSDAQAYVDPGPHAHRIDDLGAAVRRQCLRRAVYLMEEGELLSVHKVSRAAARRWKPGMVVVEVFNPDVPFVRAGDHRP